MSPASTFEMEKVAMIAGIAKLKTCTSKASSAHPPKQAQNVRRSFGASPAYQLPDPNSELGYVSIALVIAALRLSLRGEPNWPFNRRAAETDYGSTWPEAPLERLSLSSGWACFLLGIVLIFVSRAFGAHFVFSATSCAKISNTGAT